MRKKVQESDLYQFMSVLKWEVWLSMLGAVVTTALLIWILERCSPFSAKNRPPTNDDIPRYTGLLR
jgi:hypothetical protein